VSSFASRRYLAELVGVVAGREDLFSDSKNSLAGGGFLDGKSMFFTVRFIVFERCLFFLFNRGVVTQPFSGFFFDFLQLSWPAFLID